MTWLLDKIDNWMIKNVNAFISHNSDNEIFVKLTMRKTTTTGDISVSNAGGKYLKGKQHSEETLKQVFHQYQV